MTETTQFMEKDVFQLTQMIWQSTFGQSLEKPDNILADIEGSEGWVQIAGAWDGVIRIKVSDDQLIFVTKTMFLLEDDPASKNDLQEAMGELTNLIGGNIKALLPAPSQLSLPAVDLGGKNIDLSDYDPILDLPLESRDGMVQVSIFKRIK